MNTNPTNPNQELVVKVFNGWAMLPLAILLLLGSMALLIFSIVEGVRTEEHPLWLLFGTALLLELLGVLMLPGFFTLQPNQARVLLLFGAYRGTVRESGFHWG